MGFVGVPARATRGTPSRPSMILRNVPPPTSIDRQRLTGNARALLRADPDASRRFGSRVSANSIDPPARRRRLPSVRVLITLIVVVPIVVASVTLIAIGTLTSREIAEQLGYEIVSSAAAQVSTDVRDYLGSAARVSDLYVRRLSDGVLSTTDLATWQRPMFADLSVNPDVASVCFSAPNGDCTWLLRAHGRLELGIARGTSGDNAIEYAADAQGNIDRDHPIRTYHYDAPARPWFKAAQESGGPTWTPIYSWFGDRGPASETGTGYTRTIRDASGNVLGVLVVDVTLGALSEHLRQLPITRRGQAFIVDEDGLLIAASDGAVNGRDGARLSLAESDSLAARAVAELARKQPGPLGPGASILAAVNTSRIVINDEPARAQATMMLPYPGVRWQAITVLPESSFLASVESMRRNAILMASGAIVAAIAIGLLLSRRLSDPLLQLAAHVGRVGAGDFDSRLQLGQASELRRVGDEVNAMAAGLKHRMALEHSLDVAKQVQQSLLPQDVPSPAGLDVAARCTFCDATGGDYYDFIDVHHPETPGVTQTMFAVGDVTGHGIGAALLMATARGAVRSSVRPAVSLGDLLTRVNGVLTEENRSDMFMTLALAVVDPATHIVRWASAGHDPPIVYHPDTDTFEELSAGDIPLGVEPHITYRESQRGVATPGTIIVMGTDGIWEARNGQLEMFGKARLRDLMRSHSTSAAGLADAIQKALHDFVDGEPFRDDVTFIAIRIRDDAGR